MLHAATPTLDELELKESQMEKAIVEECCSMGPNNCRMVRSRVANGTVEWIACDHCGDWYHQLCVGIKHRRQVPDHYKCTRCCSLTTLSDAADSLLNEQTALPHSPVSLPSSEQSGNTAALLQAIQVVMDREEGVVSPTVAPTTE
ncbi:hypothetical protein Ciccas_006378 [Cichlidogyrus casuarinus]|uniref:Zinc finger PHD-type domain-containing protein n=1 Tax=Cichlidogyrus casuarinus TaxID=1844966 RepID=A0ABD2Q8C1_9PLAT